MTIEKINKQTLLTSSEGDREDCKVTSVDVAMLFFLDVVIVFCAIKLYSSTLILIVEGSLDSTFTDLNISNLALILF